MSDISEAYQQTRSRMAALVRGRADVAGMRVPACPEWRVQDVYAHATGVCADILGGNLDGVATDAWTQAQVDARRERSLDEILAEWDEVGPQVEAIVPAFPEAPARQLVGDIVTHEHDIRGAIGAAGARDSEAVGIGVVFLIGGFRRRTTELGLPPLTVRTELREWAVGDGDPAATVDTDTFELLRALTGRRSADQIASWTWSGDPALYLAAFQFGPFTTRAEPLVE
jgi:uncharacterized protein (TIGR03083 family)